MTPRLWCYQSQLSCHKNCKTFFFYRLQASWIHEAFALIFPETEKIPRFPTREVTIKLQVIPRDIKPSTSHQTHFPAAGLAQHSSESSSEHSQAEANTGQGSPHTGEGRGKNCHSCTDYSVPLLHRASFPLPGTIFHAPVPVSLGGLHSIPSHSL